MFQLKAKRTTLRELVAKESILAPCVYDCASALAAELCGFKAILLSGGEIEESGLGLPNLGIHTIDDLCNIVYNISSVCSLPISVDMDNGFGEPLAVFRNCDRLVKAGAMAIQLEDKACEGSEPLIPRKDYIAKIKAAVAAVEGTDCMIIARNHVNVETDFDEAVIRALEALEAGAEMTLCLPRNMDQAKSLADKIPGWKMFPDIGCDKVTGQPTANFDELATMGYNFVTMHFFLKAAMNSMIRHGRENLKAKNNYYTCQEQIDGIGGASLMPYLHPQQYLDFEAQFTNEHRIWQGAAPR